MPNFNSFGDWAKDIEEKEFERVLKGKFERIVPGNFESKLPSVSSITLFPVHDSGRHSLNVTLNYNVEDTERTATFTFGEDGAFIGKIPEGLKYSRDEIRRETLRIIEDINLDFWRETEFELLPQSDPAERDTEEVRTSSSGASAEHPLDSERLKFIESEGAVFGAVNRRTGFKGYRAAVFENSSRNVFLVLENPQKGNAAFVIDTGGPIPGDPEVVQKIKNRTASEQTYNDVINKIWKPIGDVARTRGALKELGAERVIHFGGKWKEKLHDVIEKKRNATN